MFVGICTFRRHVATCSERQRNKMHFITVFMGRGKFQFKMTLFWKNFFLLSAALLVPTSHFSVCPSPMTACVSCTVAHGHPVIPMQRCRPLLIFTCHLLITVVVFWMEKAFPTYICVNSCSLPLSFDLPLAAQFSWHACVDLSSQEHRECLVQGMIT